MASSNGLERNNMSVLRKWKDMKTYYSGDYLNVKEL